MKTKVKVDELTIEGVVYVPKDSIVNPVGKIDGMDYCVIRCKSAGAFCGWLKSLEDGNATILEAIRLWYWSGASALSQLAMEGVSNPDGCKFEMPISTELRVLEVIEVIPMTKIAKDSIQNVKSWKK